MSKFELKNKKNFNKKKTRKGWHGVEEIQLTMLRKLNYAKLESKKQNNYKKTKKNKKSENKKKNVSEMKKRKI